MPKLLFIRYKKTKTIFEGGEQCSQKNYNVLAKLLGEDNITTYYIHDENDKKRIVDYIIGSLLFLRNNFFGLTPRKVKYILSIAHDYDYVFIDRSVFGIIAKKLKSHGYNGRIITFFHNVEVAYFKAKMQKYNPLQRLILNCVDNNDRFSCQFSDKIITLNVRDTQEIEKQYKRQSDVIVPIAFKDSYIKNNISKIELTNHKLECLFLGTYFPPNNEGIIWFIKNVLPHVDIKLTIVGKGMAQLQKDEPIVMQNIEIVSDAPSLLEYFEEADVMILPIFNGSGMKVKTCEALMYAKNIIASNEALEGYELDYNKMGAKCNTEEEFISAINDFIGTPRPKYNEYVRSVFLKKYSEEAVIDQFRKVLE